MRQRRWAELTERLQAEGFPFLGSAEPQSGRPWDWPGASPCFLICEMGLWSPGLLRVLLRVQDMVLVNHGARESLARCGGHWAQLASRPRALTSGPSGVREPPAPSGPHSPRYPHPHPARPLEPAG